MSTKKTFLFILLIFLMPMIPMLISKGWIKTLDHPQSAKPPVKEDISEYVNTTIKVMNDGIVQDIPLFEYLCGVVSSEMPASYEPEALKAQAVAACSYTVYRMNAQNNSPGIFPEHNGAYVCTNPVHCKSYADTERQKEMWGEDYNRYNAKIEAAVSQVLGYILTYNGEPANTVFHAISSGKTENASDIWGNEIPYLVSVDSSSDSLSDGFETSLTLTKEDFLETLAMHSDNTYSEISIGEISRTEAGTVKNIVLCGESFTGARIREIFNLRSANFSIIQTEDDIAFTVKGYGHGVGMSQFGANQMAKDGASYTEILRKYYSGTVLEKYNFN